MEIKKLNETAVAIFTKSEEETDKLIKKLEAWKRLKDEGFKFVNWCNYDEDYGYFDIRCKTTIAPESIPNLNSIKADLDLLFGGEE